jgi:hypothetical protein
LRRDQREVEICHFGVGGRRTRQHLPKPIWRGCDAHACEPPTEASCLPAANDLASDPQPLGKLPTFVPPGGRRGHHTAKFSQRFSNIGSTRRMCSQKFEFGRFWRPRTICAQRCTKPAKARDSAQIARPMPRDPRERRLVRGRRARAAAPRTLPSAAPRGCREPRRRGVRQTADESPGRDRTRYAAAW